MSLILIWVIKCIYELFIYDNLDSPNRPKLSNYRCGYRQQAYLDKIVGGERASPGMFHF